LEENVAYIFKIEERVKQETNIKKAASESCLLHIGLLLDLVFNLADESDRFLRNVNLLSMAYTASYPRRYNSSISRSSSSRLSVY
jgi:hypothetical protein